MVDEPDYSLKEKTLNLYYKITKEIFKKKCQGPQRLSDNGTNVPPRSSDYKIKHQKIKHQKIKHQKIKHQSKFCINLPDQYRDYMKLLDNFLRKNPEKWNYVMLMLIKCKEKLERKDSAEEPGKICFDKKKISANYRTILRFLKLKLAKNPKCIVILIDKLKEYSLLESAK